MLHQRHGFLLPCTLKSNLELRIEWNGCSNLAGRMCLSVSDESGATEMEHLMKKFWLAAVGLIALGTAAPALAAVLAARPYVKAPPMVAPVYDWTGFYIGANGGWGQAHGCWDLVPLVGAVISDGCRNASGGVAGGQLG